MEFSIIFFRLVCLGALALSKLKCEMPWFCVPEHWFVLNWAIKYQKKIGVNLGEAFLNVSIAGQYSVSCRIGQLHCWCRGAEKGKEGTGMPSISDLLKKGGGSPPRKPSFWWFCSLVQRGTFHCDCWLVCRVRIHLWWVADQHLLVFSGAETLFKCWLWIWEHVGKNVVMLFMKLKEERWREKYFLICTACNAGSFTFNRELGITLWSTALISLHFEEH